MADEHHIEEWTEVHITGQPDGPYPPYDFTFRSDRDHWAELPRFLGPITQAWTDVRVEHRTVRRETWTSPWASGPPVPAALGAATDTEETRDA